MKLGEQGEKGMEKHWMEEMGRGGGQADVNETTTGRKAVNGGGEHTKRRGKK